MKDREYIAMLRKDAKQMRAFADKYDEAADRLESASLDTKIATHTYADPTAASGQDAPANEKLKGYIYERLEQAGLEPSWLKENGYPGGIESMSTHTANLALDAIYAYCVEKKIPARHLEYHANRRGWRVPDTSAWTS